MKKLLVVSLLIVCTMGKLNAQSDLQIFGFFQAGITKTTGHYSITADVPKSVFGTDKLVVAQKSNDYLSSSLQQMNLYLRKELTPNITAWTNFQVVGNLNVSDKFGNISLEEAWVNYQANDAFNIKAGLLIPRFAYMNEIKNRMPLLPYITRPLVYEAGSNPVNYARFIPEHAFVQINGYFPTETITFDYSAFIGSSEKSYIIAGGAGGSSADTTNFKLFGGRVGLKYGELRFGVSATFDKENQQKTIKEDVDRTRLAFDLGYAAYGFFAEAEYIKVNLSAKNTNVDQNKLFYYGTLGYNFSQSLFAYGSYSYVEDKEDNILSGGLNGLILGAGYRVSDSCVIKGGYSTYYTNNSFPLVVSSTIPAVNAITDINYKMYQLSVSVLF